MSCRAASSSASHRHGVDHLAETDHRRRADYCIGFDHTAQIVDLLTSLVDDSGASMLFITHDFSVLRRATTRCYVLSEGHVVESGATSMLLECPTTPEATNLVRAARELSLDVEGGR